MDIFNTFIAVFGLLIGMSSICIGGSMEDTAVEDHNKFRAIHGSPPLALDDELSAFADKHAEYLLNLGKMEHTKNNKYGENLFMLSVKGRALPDDTKIVNIAVKAWYDEISKYNYKKPGFSQAAGHFTQLVWKESTLVGIGLRKNDKLVFLVAEYSPRGNMMNAGQFAKNVLPVPGKGKPGNPTGGSKDGSDDGSGVESGDEEPKTSKSSRLTWGTKIVSYFSLWFTIIQSKFQY